MSSAHQKLEHPRRQSRSVTLSTLRWLTTSALQGSIITLREEAHRKLGHLGQEVGGRIRRAALDDGVVLLPVLSLELWEGEEELDDRVLTRGGRRGEE